MDGRCIALYDSGAGGLTLLKTLRENYPKENFAYFSDRKNFPYGNKTSEEIKALAKVKIKSVLSFCPKAIIFACNTLSAAALGSYTNFPVKVFGVLPKVYGGEKSLIVATPSTAKSEYIKNLKRGETDADVFSADGLATEVERWICGGEKPDLSARFSGVDKSYKAVVLGCTHYSFLKKDFAALFPSSVIRDGADETFKQVQGWLPTKENAGTAGELFFDDDTDKRIFYRFLMGF